jgi:GAF domain-containing protein
MLARKHRLAVGGQSIVGWVTAQRQPRVALDVGADAVHFKNPDLPHTRSEMALPLVVGDRLLGALDVQSTEEAAFDEEDVAILSLMADQVAVAINNALKFSQEAAVLEATSPLYRASRHIALATSLDGVLRGILDHAAGPYVDRCSINLYASATDEEPQGVSGWVEVAALWDRAADPPDPSGTCYPLPAGGETERDAHLPRRRGGEPAGAQSLMNDLRRERAEPLVVDDLLAKVVDHRVDSETGSLLSEKLGLRAALILPMVAGGQTSGWLMVASRQPHAWTEAEVRTFRSLTDQAAVAVQHVRLFQETQTRAAREQVIRQITEQLWRAVDVESILQTAVSKLGQATRAPRVYVRLGTEEISNGK